MIDCNHDSAQDVMFMSALQDDEYGRIEWTSTATLGARGTRESRCGMIEVSS